MMSVRELLVVCLPNGLRFGSLAPPTNLVNTVRRATNSANARCLSAVQGMLGWKMILFTKSLHMFDTPQRLITMKAMLLMQHLDAEAGELSQTP